MGSRQNERRSVNPFVAGGAIVGVFFAILLIVTLVNVFRRNPYGPETRIDNFEDYYSDVSQNEKDLIFFQLYSTLEDNLAEGVSVPESGAMVRKDTAEYSYNEGTKVYYGNFVVDVKAVQRSYRVQFEWSKVQDNQELGGYPVLISCLPMSLRIYEGDDEICQDMFSANVTWINEYQLDYTFGANVSYNIREMLQEYFMENVEAGSYTATVDETSFARIKDQPDFTYRFKLKLNDEEMAVLVRVDQLYGKQYIAILVERGEKTGLIASDSEEMKASLKNWLLAMSGSNELKVTSYKLAN